MKDIFGTNNYRFGLESSLLMYLNQYQFVLGSDLERYSKSDETFSKNNPCNIYFILRRPKVTVNPNPTSINGNQIGLEFLIHNKSDIRILQLSFEFKKAKSELEFKTDYPYNLFTISDKKGVLLGARPSTLLDSNIEDEYEIPELDYEVLYIGQAYGKNGRRTALDRLAAHETVQKIYIHSLNNYPDSDIWILLTNFSQQSMIFIAGADLVNVNEEDSKIEEKKFQHLFENNGLSFTERQKINFTEAALIRYFQPKYNIEFKDNFPSNKHKSYSECYDLDVREITIEVDLDIKRKLYTDKTGRKDTHRQTFEFTSADDRMSILNMLE